MGQWHGMVWIMSYSLFLFYLKSWKILGCWTVMSRSHIFLKNERLFHTETGKAGTLRYEYPSESLPHTAGGVSKHLCGWAANWGCHAAVRQHCHHTDRKLLGSTSIICPLAPLWKLTSWIFPVVNIAAAVQQRIALSQSYQMGKEMFRTFKITQKWESEAQCRVKQYLLDIIDLNYISLHWSNCKPPPISSWIQIFSGLVVSPSKLNSLFETFPVYWFFFPVMTHWWHTTLYFYLLENQVSIQEALYPLD